MRRVQAKQPKKKKKKPNMGVGESFTFLAKSPYIRDLALLVRAPHAGNMAVLRPFQEALLYPQLAPAVDSN